jgi:hypothetical protein
VSFTYGEAIALTRGLLIEVGSHYHASRSGWSYPSSLADLFTTMHTEAYLNVHRDEKTRREPYVLPRPWDKHEAPPTDDERDKLLKVLERRSAFRDR